MDLQTPRGVYCAVLGWDGVFKWKPLEVSASFVCPPPSRVSESYAGFRVKAVEVWSFTGLDNARKIAFEEFERWMREDPEAFTDNWPSHGALSLEILLRVGDGSVSMGQRILKDRANSIARAPPAVAKTT